MDPFGQDKFLSLFDVSEQTGESLATIETWLKSGLQYNQLPGYRAVMQSDLAAWMKDRRKADVTPNAETANSDRLMAPQAYADMCDFPVRHIEKWIDEGLPVHERNGVRHINRDEVYAFVKTKNALLDDVPPRGTQSGSIAGESTEHSIIVAE